MFKEKYILHVSVFLHYLQVKHVNSISNSYLYYFLGQKLE